LLAGRFKVVGARLRAHILAIFRRSEIAIPKGHAPISSGAHFASHCLRLYLGKCSLEVPDYGCGGVIWTSERPLRLLIVVAKQRDIQIVLRAPQFRRV
jgi:hypothetical protein